MSAYCPICRETDPALVFRVRGEPIYRCRACTASFRPVWLQTRDDVATSQVAAFGERYVRSRRSIATWLRLDANRSLRSIRRLRPARGDFLEIGCATGELCVAARDHGYAVEGIELSEAAARFACEEYGLTVHAKTIEELAVERPASFDVVAAIHTLEHLPDPVTATRQIAELLRPGGYLYVEVPSASSWDLRLHGPRSEILTDEHLFFHTVASMRQLFAACGFEVVGVGTIEGYSGLFNEAIDAIGVKRAAAAVVRRLRGRAIPDPLDHSAPEATTTPVTPSSRELLVDAGRAALTGAAMITGLFLSPLRWTIGYGGFGGAIRAIGRKPGSASSRG